MNREIKVKVWDKGKKEMSIGMPLVMLAGYLGAIYPKLGNEIFLEYTGLEDKNGKEIYEGDRIQIGKMWWVVFWNQPQARFGFRMHYKGKYIYASPAQITRKGEIIGNIYESL